MCLSEQPLYDGMNILYLFRIQFLHILKNGTELFGILIPIVKEIPCGYIKVIADVEKPLSDGMDFPVSILLI